MKTINLAGFDKARNVVLEIQDDRVWVGSERGLYTIDRISKQVLQTSLVSEEIFSEDDLAMVEVAVDKRGGVLWLASEGPVVRYDGKEVKIFTEKDGLPREDIPFYLKVDNEGAVWIGYSGEVYRFDGDRWYASKLKADQLGFDSRGKTYAADSHVLTIIGEGTSRSVVINKNFNSHDSGDSPSCIYVDRDEPVWIGTSANGVIVVRGDDITRLGGRDSGEISSTTGIEKDSKGDLWIGSYRNLYCVNAETFETSNYGLRGILPGIVTDFCVDKEDNFWILMRMHRGTRDPDNKLIFLRREEVFAPEGEVKEEKGRFNGLPVVRVSGFEYSDLGVVSDFWNTPEHTLMAKVCEERRKDDEMVGFTEFQKEILAEMIELGRKLDEKELEQCMRIFMDTPVRQIPVLAEKIVYEGKNAWVLVANWGMDWADYAHIVLEVIDENSNEKVMSERCC